MKNNPGMDGICPTITRKMAGMKKQTTSKQPVKFKPDDMRAIMRCHRRKHSIARDLRLSPRVLAELIRFEASLFFRELLPEYYVEMLSDRLEDYYEEHAEFRRKLKERQGRAHYLEGYLRVTLSKFLGLMRGDLERRLPPMYHWGHSPFSPEPALREVKKLPANWEMAVLHEMSASLKHALAEGEITSFTE